MTSETTLRAAPQSEAVELARRLAARTMRTWSLIECEEQVTAIVAELVANAVRHAGTVLELRLQRRPGAVRVEVRDRASAMPQMTVPAPLDESRRGLFIVDRFASDWGAIPVTGGKVVWAEVAT
ncbi:Histidine kinase-like ATPase domain-containing protein [Thermomonospora echinospora]|uniref:Histidine kinase-like ATPase domain-containing protein n=1 Tax=Thermomonospora echinospora TaxID=1992 RepID=A0A1H6ED89_9ACTN|nr:ATP-binding protein [Thermomonospora echinospora]SEG94775.1 Histidine kinase-like ATPase domain-containing protein [Thermomonospora echinospora]